MTGQTTLLAPTDRANQPVGTHRRRERDVGRRGLAKARAALAAAEARRTRDDDDGDRLCTAA